MNSLSTPYLKHKWRDALEIDTAETIFKRYTGTLLSSLSKADFTRFQHKIFSKPITIVNTALFVLNFLNLPQGDIFNNRNTFRGIEGHFSSSAHLVSRRVQ